MASKLVQQKIDLNFAEQLHADSRVWVYHADRIFSDTEVNTIQGQINDFCHGWVSHNQQLKTAGTVLFNRIVLLMVDETMVKTSGCSIDSSVAFVKNLGLKYQTNLFDRMLITYIDQEEVITASLHDLKSKIKEEDKSGVYFFDNLIKTKKDLQEHGLTLIVGSWLERYL